MRYSRQNWDVRVVTTVAEACRKLQQPEVGCVISHRNWPWVVGPLAVPGCIGSQEGVGSYLCLLTAWWMLQWFVVPTSGVRDHSCSLTHLWHLLRQRWQPTCPPLGSQTAAVASPTCGTYDGSALHLQAHGDRGSL